MYIYVYNITLPNPLEEYKFGKVEGKSMGRGCSRGNAHFFMSFNFLKAKRNHKNKTELLFTKDLNKTIFSEDQKILLTGTIKELKFLLLWNHRFFIRHF